MRRGHFDAVIVQRPGNVQLVIDTADSLRLCRVADQPYSLAGSAQSNGNLGA